MGNPCTNLSWAIPEKIQTRGVEDIFFWKSPWNFSSFDFTPENSRQNKDQPLDITQTCVRSLGNSKAKNKEPSGNSKLVFLGHPWKCHLVFN